jgi:hypothetical protein
MRRADHSSSSESTSNTGTGRGKTVQRAETNIIHSQGKKQRQHGNDAVKSHILAAKTVANIVKSSLVCTGWRDKRKPRKLIHLRDPADSTRS